MGRRAVLKHPRLGEPLRLGPIEVTNRIVMPPMVVWKAWLDGSVTPAILDHYWKSARQGMVIVEVTAMSPEERLAREQLGAFDDRHAEGLARIAGLIDAAGSAASIQLHHQSN